MVLDQADIDAEFPGLPLDVEDSGYTDNEASAEDTLDPGDSATGARHVPEGQTVSHSTTPPTSGTHWPVWANCGVYDTEIPDEIIVHNMEHGHVVISHNLSDQEVNGLLQVVGGLGDFDK